MANNAVIGGKVSGKRGGCGGGGGGGGRGGRGRGKGGRGSGSEDGSDVDYVVGGDGEEEYESSEDSYSTDVSQEDSEERSCSEEEEEEDGEDEGEYEPRMEDASSWRRRRGMTLEARRRRKRAASTFVPVEKDVKAEEEMVAPLMRTGRALRRLRPTIPAEDEGEDCDDEEDEDFAPDEDEDDEEEMESSPFRGPGGGRNSHLKAQRGRAGARNSNLRESRAKAPITNNRRRRIVETSDDEDFIVKEGGISVDAAVVEKKRRMQKKGDSRGGKRRMQKKGDSRGRKRRTLAFRSNPSDSESSDSGYEFSLEESSDLRVRRHLANLLERSPPSAAVQADKGKGKDDGDPGKQICGICLSEEKKGVIRGLLNCCAHYFCFVCIMEWSKVESRCPLCKRRFKTLSKLSSSDSGIHLRKSVISVPERDQVYQPSEEEIRGYLDPYANVVCIECHQGVDDNLLLLCDICDSPAHTYCVGLGSEVPEGNWYCDGCRCVENGSPNMQHQESVLEHRATTEEARVNPQNGIAVGNVSVCTPHEHHPQRLMPLPFQHPSDEIGEDASGTYPLPVYDRDTELRTPGFAASTVSGRRSLHRHIRNMISLNWMRCIPEGMDRDNVIQAAIIENNLSVYGTRRHLETLHGQQEGSTNGIDERSRRSVLGSGADMHSFSHNEGTSCQKAEAAWEFHH